MFTDMPPAPHAPRARLCDAGRWPCLAGALLLGVLCLVSNWSGLKCWGTIGGYRACLAIQRGSASILVASAVPAGVEQPWSLQADPTISDRYEWWSWFRARLSDHSGWTHMWFFPSWLPIPVLCLAAAAFWRTHSRAVQDMITRRVAVQPMRVLS
jgi:hypothetical protein